MYSLVMRNINACFRIKSIVYYKNAISKLHLLECNGKELLRNFGVNVQDFIIINQSDNVKNVINKLDFKSSEYVIKSQILAGGRCLGIFENGFKGGVHIANKSNDIEDIIKSMMGHRLITKQTSKSGSLVTKIMVTKSIKIVKETYFCIMLDSCNNGPIVIASPNGGIDIENSRTDVKIFPIDINEGIAEEKATEIATYLGFDKKLHAKVVKQIRAIWNTFIQTDALLIEINPFVENENGDIFVVDVKTNFDDNALFRQDKITKLGEENNDELNKLEYEANQHNLNYISLDGNIGCLVNGAGLAMATMDIIQLNGGKPANFLDVGGGVNKEQVSIAIKILLNDEKVKSILINIFGGIVDCKIIADGIIDTLKCTKTQIPLIVRLKGNNVDEAKQLLSELDKHMLIQFTDNLHKAAKLAVAAT